MRREIFMEKKKQFNKAWVGLLSMLFLLSCATYNQKLNAYYASVEGSNYEEANRLLDKNRFLKKDRNLLLFYLEKGKISHLRGQYDSSNTYFNLADAYMENERKSVGDFFSGNLLNPMQQKYLGEYHERFLIHYYKALNYTYLNKRDEARVEARRITLTTDAIDDRIRSSNKYQQDAFSFIMQGLVYEANGEINNAFISYRNAVDLYLNHKGTYYGVQIPQQLKEDLLRTAKVLGFNDLFSFYQTRFNLPAKSNQIDTTTGGELVVFFEYGMGPIKQEQNFTVMQNGAGSSNFYFTNSNGITQNFNVSGNRAIDISNLKNFSSMRIALPYYQERNSLNPFSMVVVNGQKYQASLVQNVNVIANEILNERLIKEITNALIRQLSKKAVEKGVEAVAKSIAEDKNKKDNSKSDSEKQKDKNRAEAVGAAAGLLINIVNNATEKADTRNWQSLPAFIQYVRLPLSSGINEITLYAGTAKKIIRVNGNGNLQLMNWITK